MAYYPSMSAGLSSSPANNKSSQRSQNGEGNTASTNIASSRVQSQQNYLSPNFNSEEIAEADLVEHNGLHHQRESANERYRASLTSPPRSFFEQSHKTSEINDSITIIECQLNMDKFGPHISRMLFGNDG